MNQLTRVLGSVRPNFMILSPLCVLLGIGVAVAQGVQIDTGLAVLAVIGGMLAHAAVNLLNEYDDFRSGLDSITVRTPFSGGSGTLPAHPDAAQATLFAGIACLVGTTLIGLYVVTVRGFGIVPLGLLGLVIVVAYTPWITRRPLLCLFAPGIGFGPLMVMGTAYVLTGSYSWSAVWASLVPLFLVSELLLVNQFPDVEADRQVGRHHLPISIGRKASARVFAAFVLAAFAVIGAGLAVGAFPPWAAIGLLPLPAALYLARNVVRQADNQPALVPLLGINVGVILGTILLLSVGLLIA
ncbi:MAG: prenyltransferase [Nevskiales bacterium]|nr:prenyltransferase [Nevskiales bacterium]